MIIWHVSTLFRLVKPSPLFVSLFSINYFNFGYAFPLDIYDDAGGQMPTEILVFRGHLSLARAFASFSLPSDVSM